MIRSLIILMNCAVVAQSFGQSFEPLPGEPGSTAMHKDSSAFIAWATGVVAERGPMDIQYPLDGDVSHGTESDAVGPADGSSVISLGDGGVATVSFALPITNGPGYDFAVFENGFADNYIELAFVEVSSDGVNFARFPAISEAPVEVQYWNGSFSDCRYFNNLAGKYRANYGTPFDLEELSDSTDIDITAISHVRIIDVVGSIDFMYGTFDSQGNIINDPYPTAFHTGGFDLDGIGVIHEGALGLDKLNSAQVNVFPNPSSGKFYIQSEQEVVCLVLDIHGKAIYSGTVNSMESIDISFAPQGVYFLKIETEQGVTVQKLNKL